MLIFEDAKKIFYRLFKKQQRNMGELGAWRERELQLLNWVLMNYATQHKKKVEVLSELDWRNISHLIPGRSSGECKREYEIHLKPASTAGGRYVRQAEMEMQNAHEDHAVPDESLVATEKSKLGGIKEQAHPSSNKGEMKTEGTEVQLGRYLTSISTKECMQ
eukprot:TRINITY_DN3489_c0_g1_i6.p1 TRINITY_DN3489_c0_g1~~TRINITY_DN3489_c0_g1_i6.p1  ORF type:complete len:162 (+),score=25.85 TRINITY_DN3489_c0_g1_i6:559-1044(+)